MSEMLLDCEGIEQVRSLIELLGQGWGTAAYRNGQGCPARPPELHDTLDDDNLTPTMMISGWTRSRVLSGHISTYSIWLVPRGTASCYADTPIRIVRVVRSERTIHLTIDGHVRHTWYRVDGLHRDLGARATLRYVDFERPGPFRMAEELSDTHIADIAGLAPCTLPRGEMLIAASLQLFRRPDDPERIWKMYDGANPYAVFTNYRYRDKKDEWLDSREYAREQEKGATG